MSTIVFVHAHPDDEASQTSGTMTLASARGHRVVVVYGTNGDHGEVPDDLGDEPLVAYRRREAEASARVTGAARVVWLDYADSGMSGWEQNGHEASFHSAPLDEAAGRLAAVLDEEHADVVIGYDWHGNYGHPDHVKVHQVVHRAAALATGRPRLLEATMNRDYIRRQYALARQMGQEVEFDPDRPMDDGNPMGTPEAEIHYQVDIRDVIESKRAALACHASQKTDIESFLSMPLEMFREAFRYEYFIEPGREPGMKDAWPFD